MCVCVQVLCYEIEGREGGREGGREEGRREGGTEGGRTGVFLKC